MPKCIKCGQHFPELKDGQRLPPCPSPKAPIHPITKQPHHIFK